jgi:hypothetical protein
LVCHYASYSLDQSLGFSLYRVLILLSYCCGIHDDLVVVGQVLDDGGVCFSGSCVASDLAHHMSVRVVVGDDQLEGCEVGGGILVLDITAWR